MKIIKSLGEKTDFKLFQTSLKSFERKRDDFIFATAYGGMQK